MLQDSALRPGQRGLGCERAGFGLPARAPAFTPEAAAEESHGEKPDTDGERAKASCPSGDLAGVEGEQGIHEPAARRGGEGVEIGSDRAVERAHEDPRLAVGAPPLARLAETDRPPCRFRRRETDPRNDRAGIAGESGAHTFGQADARRGSGGQQECRRLDR